MQFQPAIRRLGVAFELPRPIVSLRLHDAWDFERFKIPLVDGDLLAAHSRCGVDVSLEGQIGSRGGQLALSESQMFAELEALRAALDVADAGDRYELVLYRDDSTGATRCLRDCTTVRFEYDLSNPRLFSYAAVIHASDPQVHWADG